jgi:hypothetical protein
MQPEQRPPSRLAAGFVIVGLTLSAIGIAYIIYAGRERELPPISAPEPDPRIEQLHALLTLLMLSFFLVLVFLLGSYLMVRIGRGLLARKRLRHRTEYVDGWGSYRLTQDQIDSATQQLKDSLASETPPDPDEGGPEPSDDEP